MEKTLAELVARMEKILSEQDEITRTANLENTDGTFTEEQRSQYKALDGMFDSLAKQKALIEEDMERINARNTRQELTVPKILTRKSASNSGAAVVTHKQVRGLPIEHQNEETGETRINFKIGKNVLRIGRPANFHGLIDGYTAEERAYRFGQYVLARISEDLPGRYNFQYAKEFVKNYIQPMNVSHSESDGTTGGHYLVPDEFSRDIIILRERFGIARYLFNKAPMTSDILHTPRRATGLTAYFVGENQVGTESNMTWNDVVLTAKQLMAISRMSNQLNADAVISIGDTLAGEMAYAFAKTEDGCAFIGDGTSTYGGIQGAAKLLVNIDGAGTASAGVQTQATSNTWLTQVLADFNATLGLLPQYADTPNTTWVCHKTYYHTVMQRLELAAGGVTALEVADGDRRPRPLFLGYPVTFSQIMPSATATTGVTTLLGEFNLGTLMGDRQQTSISFSEHATIGGENVFERNQIAVRGVERMDIVVHGCGTASVVGPIVGLRTG